MNITQETLTWPFKDPEWKNKFIIGSALALAGTLIPLVGLLGLLVVYGYALIIMRQVMQGEAPKLPKWDKLGEMFIDGLKAMVSSLGYFIPVVLISCCSLLFLFTAMFGGIALSSNSTRGVNAGFPLMFIAWELGFFVTIGIVTLLFILGIIPTPIAVGQYARTGEIGAGYRVREVWQILRSNMSGFLLAWVIYVGFVYVTSFSVYFAYATIILCFLLPVILAPISFYLSLLYAIVFGMAYREGIAKAGIETSD